MKLSTLAVAALAFGLIAHAPMPAAHAQPPGGPGAGAPQVPLPPKLKALETKLTGLETRFKKYPKDAKLKADIVETSYQLGHGMMHAPELPPRVKYRGALKHFNRTLQLDPKHKKAAADKKTIEDIYKQMGLPVPK